MGTGGLVAPAVADAGPLIHLAEIGEFSLLQIFEMLHIPGAVLKETVGACRIQEKCLAVLSNVRHHTLTETDVSRFVQKYKLQNLHVGERESLLLCQQISVSLLLTDDLAVRRSAKSFGLTPVGSLGVVVKAYRLGDKNLDEAKLLIAKLYDESSLFVTRTIVDMAIERLCEIPGGK